MLLWEPWILKPVSYTHLDVYKRQELECIDITHEIEAYNILAASREIIYVEPFWPKGTVFVSVVDPGVGTDRRACVAKLHDGNYIVTPDNGTLTHLYYEVGIDEVRRCV